MGWVKGVGEWGVKSFQCNKNVTYITYYCVFDMINLRN